MLRGTVCMKRIFAAELERAKDMMRALDYNGTRPSTSGGRGAASAGGGGSTGGDMCSAPPEPRHSMPGAAAAAAMYLSYQSRAHLALPAPADDARLAEYRQRAAGWEDAERKRRERRESEGRGLRGVRREEEERSCQGAAAAAAGAGQPRLDGIASKSELPMDFFIMEDDAKGYSGWQPNGGGGAAGGDSRGECGGVGGGASFFHMRSTAEQEEYDNSHNYFGHTIFPTAEDATTSAAAAAAAYPAAAAAYPATAAASAAAAVADLALTLDWSPPPTPPRAPAPASFPPPAPAQATTPALAPAAAAPDASPRHHLHSTAFPPNALVTWVGGERELTNVPRPRTYDPGPGPAPTPPPAPGLVRRNTTCAATLEPRVNGGFWADAAAAAAAAAATAAMEVEAADRGVTRDRDSSLGVSGSARGVSSQVGRCRFTLSKPVLIAPMVSVLEATI